MSLIFDKQILGLTLVPFGGSSVASNKTEQKRNEQFDGGNNIHNDETADYDNKTNSGKNYKNTESASNDTESGRKESAEVTTKLQSSIRAPAVVSLIVNKDIVG